MLALDFCFNLIRVAELALQYRHLSGLWNSLYIKGCDNTAFRSSVVQHQKNIDAVVSDNFRSSQDLLTTRTIYSKFEKIGESSDSEVSPPIAPCFNQARDEHDTQRHGAAGV